MIMFEATCVVLECKSGVSKSGNKYNVALLRVRGENGKEDSIGKVFSDVPLAVNDSEQVLVLGMKPNKEMFFSFRVVGYAKN